MDDRRALIAPFLEPIKPPKSAQRATTLSDHSRSESDADHSRHLELLAMETDRLQAFAPNVFSIGNA